ncbi:MAG TPA: tetratricopeptide repeat protein [Alphaproteobacteria bacterium]|nr:tetratricopeptide repeat protein [Alphaproteobacteria bacterium]
MPVPKALELAEQRRQEGDLAAAETLCRQILQAQPRQSEALHLLGIIAHQVGNYPVALEFMRQAVAINANVPLFHCNLGELYRLNGMPNEAITAAHRALALNPKYAQALNNLGIAHYDREEFDEAIKCYRQALEIDRGYVEARSNLGNAFRALKRHDEAIACYQRAIKQNPNYADAYNNLGTSLRDIGKIDEAEGIYRKALALKPTDPAVLNNLSLAVKDFERLDEASNLLAQSIAIDPRNYKTYTYLALVRLDQNRLDEAMAACEQALAIRPEDPEALNAKGQVIFDRGQVNQALETFRKVLSLKPDMADAHNNMGNALKELGQLDAAREAYIKSLEINPKESGVYVNLADSKSFKADDPHIKGMEELLRDGPSLTPKARTHLHFALGKAYGDLRQYETSFGHLREGNALKRKQIAYDEAGVLGLFDRVRANMDRKTIESRAGQGDPSNLPIFVLGMPRSGTTLVEQIVASHPKVFGAGELTDFGAVIETVRGPDGALLPYPEFVPALEASHLRAIAQEYITRLRAISANAERITDKMPSNFFFVGLIHLVLPNAPIIHVMRDPVDTCISCFSKLFSGAQDHTYDLAELGRYYTKYVELMEHWRTALPAGRVLDIQYEDLIADFEPQARRIVEYCGLAWHKNCLVFHKTDRPVRTASATQVRKPIYKTSIGRWRVYGEHLAPLFDALGPFAPKTSGA